VCFTPNRIYLGPCPMSVEKDEKSVEKEGKGREKEEI
jgi:hypothetical protein